MRARRHELATWEVLEVGKGWREADADVAEAIDFLTFYAREMRRLETPRQLGTEPGEQNDLRYAPRGLTAVVSPWNFPLAIPTGMTAAALVAGNAVLFKPSERSPVMGYWLSSLLHEAGLPDSVLQFLPGGPEVGHVVVSRPEVAVVAFTGSKDVGLRILSECSQLRPGQHHVTRVIAEMGGKNAIIIDETADMDEAVTGVVSSFTGFQGQKCSACSRAIVLAPVYDLFLQRLSEAVQSLRIGPPEDPSNRVGPMIDERAKEKTLEYLEIGKQEGRLVLARSVEPSAPHSEGYFVGPAVFADIRPHHRLAQEEIFGPVLAVMRAENFGEALALANSTQYALTGGVYSRSPAHLETARREFDVGNLYINRPITGALVARQPFGGHRLSGVGAKAGGEEYLTQFMIARVVSENTIRRGFAPPR
jgi:RHH-type proline utilization regulon transcriptional repressor/proline dehydrogenase/delta 1-pyrroline-5-carboxylate dehydrogenase